MSYDICIQSLQDEKESPSANQSVVRTYVCSHACSHAMELHVCVQSVTFSLVIRAIPISKADVRKI